MERVRHIFTQSYWFWVISKIILILILLTGTISILGLGKLRSEEIIINTFGLVEAILLLITLVADFSASLRFKGIKVLTGVVLIVFGLGLIITLLIIAKGSQSDFYMLGYPFGFWMMLIGLFDLLNIKRTKPSKA